ncbi:MAG: NAD-dependent deacetylase [Kiritimatiellae bacterium]|nr:NAD-dependent deacetylase [Kiritimatiellia bacterium]
MEILIDAIKRAKTTMFFTGAGVSTLCGIPDFRGPDGVYRDPDAARMFEIDLFDRDPGFFYSHADALVYGNSETRPGPVHEALVALQKAGKCAGVATQNIDGLHERAGSDPVFAVHGSAALHHCRRCGAQKTFDEIRALRAGVPGAVPLCEKCGGPFKPDITFFGEALPEEAFRGAMELAGRCDLMVVLGSSLVVQPAASIPLAALRAGARLAIVNRGETPLDRFAFFRADDLAAFAQAVQRSV